MAGAAATAAGADATAAGAPDSAAAAAAMVTCGGGGCGTAASADPSALACSQAHSSSALPYPGPASSHAAAARLAGDAGQRPDSQQSLGGAEKSGETGYREYSGEKRTVSPDEKSGEKRPQPEGNGVPAGAASSVVGPLELGRAVEPGRAVESGISGGQAQMHHSYFIARPEVGLYLVVVYQGVQARRQADRQTHEFMRELLGKLQIAKMYKRLRP
ncbi:hypothetical protein T492DRAFT_835645 [Pavlovales sp. CCMP2436]|nr:hypothetical protein T492DRAFT_835645 [Pavlovales sp. CCMP2436]